MKRARRHLWYRHTRVYEYAAWVGFLHQARTAGARALAKSRIAEALLGRARHSKATRVLCLSLFQDAIKCREQHLFWNKYERLRAAAFIGRMIVKYPELREESCAGME